MKQITADNYKAADADFEQRSDFEELLGRRLGRAQRTQYQALLKELGTEPDLSKIPPSFWDDLSSEYNAAIRPTLEAIMLEHIQQRIRETDIGVDFAEANARAADWAKQYTFELVKGITDNTQRVLRTEIEDFYRDSRTIQDLERSISPLFGPVRAEMIAVTETTRAAAEGEAVFEDELRKLGLDTVQIWQTSNDDIVCPICEPLNLLQRGQGWNEPPPAHVNCRCWLTTEVKQLA